jgi:hypothetical protein
MSLIHVEHLHNQVLFALEMIGVASLEVQTGRRILKQMPKFVGFGF